MNSKLMVEGKRYAHRANPRGHDGEIIRVRFTGVLRGHQAKVQWVDGEDAGRVDWVRTETILSPWGQRRAFLKDEERRDLLLTEDREHADPVISEAVDLVILAAGEMNGIHRIWSGEPAVIQRMWNRAHLDGSPLTSPLSYADRYGQWHLSSVTAHRWAVAFAAAEPDTVRMYIDAEEKEALARGYQPGERIHHEFLRTSRPAYALARDWTGKGVHSHLEEEINRLQGVVSRAISYLEKKGHPQHAGILRRDLEGQ